MKRIDVALALIVFAPGCGGPIADNSHIQTPDDQPIGVPRFPGKSQEKPADQKPASAGKVKPIGGKGITIGGTNP